MWLHTWFNGSHFWKHIYIWETDFLFFWKVLCDKSFQYLLSGGLNEHPTSTWLRWHHCNLPSELCCHNLISTNAALIRLPTAKSRDTKPEVMQRNENDCLAIENTASPLSSPVDWLISLYKASLAVSCKHCTSVDSSGAALGQMDQQRQGHRAEGTSLSQQQLWQPNSTSPPHTGSPTCHWETGGKPQTSTSCLLQLLSSSWQSPRAALHTCPSPTVGCDSGWQTLLLGR